MEEGEGRGGRGGGVGGRGGGVGWDGSRELWREKKWKWVKRGEGDRTSLVIFSDITLLVVFMSYSDDSVNRQGTVSQTKIKLIVNLVTIFHNFNSSKKKLYHVNFCS